MPLRFSLRWLVGVVIVAALLASFLVPWLLTRPRPGPNPAVGSLVSQALALTRQLAAETRETHFLRFENGPDHAGIMTVFRDTNRNGVLDGADVSFEGHPVRLTPGNSFTRYPPYLGVGPDGRVVGIVDIPSGRFETSMQDSREDGEIILSAGRFVICIDIDPAAGKVRKATYLAAR